MTCIIQQRKAAARRKLVEMGKLPIKASAILMPAGYYRDDLGLGRNLIQ